MFSVIIRIHCVNSHSVFLYNTITFQQRPLLPDELQPSGSFHHHPGDRAGEGDRVQGEGSGKTSSGVHQTSVAVSKCLYDKN